MLKKLSKFRFGKKKEKRAGDNADLPNGNSVDYSDDQLSEKGSNAGDHVSIEGLKVSPSDKSLDSYNNGKVEEEEDTNIPTMCSSEESIIDETVSQDEEEEEDVEDFSIPIEELKKVYATKHADEDRLFREEMKGLSNRVAKHTPTCEYAKLPQNKEKNRYKNIVTSDKARVVLQRIEDDPFSDYINASYINGYSKERKFIATQGPKPGTVNDFWRMAWEQNIQVIVMVTDYRENGKVKCEHYFPETGSEQYGNIYVECKQVSSHGEYVQRTLAIRYEDEEIFENDEPPDEEQTDNKEVRLITHLQCKKWPDHGVPKTTSSIYRLYQKMLESQPEDSNSPILVHCSAGVGRTGTLIGLDILIGQLTEKKNVNVYDTVIQMRKQRTEMVQGLDQYVLLHKLILEYNFYGQTDYTVAEFEEVMKKFETEDEESAKLQLKSEFDLLSLIPPQNARFGSGSLPQNAEKNRDSGVIPYEHSQIFIRMRPAEMRPPFVNASPLLTYDSAVEVIATQAPLSSSIEDFWRVVNDNTVTCIVMLTPTAVDDVECCPQYWPTEGDMTIGDITVQHENAVEHANYIETRLTLTSTDREKVNREVIHIQYGSWLENAPIPENCDSVLLEMIAHVDMHVQKLQKEQDNKFKPKIIVHCSDGAGRTGVFCSLINLIQRLKSENKIDVFRAVKDLRDCRPCMVRTADQYNFCHRIISTYLRSFDLYSNGS